MHYSEPTTTRALNVRALAWGTVGLLLLLPAAAMTVTDEVSWSAGDFRLAALLLAGPGLMFELIIRRNRNVAYRLGCAVALATAVSLVWINLAVGIIGSEDNPANLMFASVLAVAGAIATLGRLRPGGLRWAMIAAAAAQSTIAAFAWGAGAKVLLLNLAFVAAWASAAWLFATAERAMARA